ncbi:LAFA_0D00606g1_1 [Lachancea sp. 'fantastica']|nr:LAFA_0D00606g1_1 [Lachancea sp. 'fantastica']
MSCIKYCCVIRLLMMSFSKAHHLSAMNSMESGEDLGDRISRLALKLYDKLQAGCKPAIRSNGVQEWTVLACIVAIDRTNGQIQLISMATGVKATPDRELSRSQGRMLHDCHAEILAIRGFNTVLLQEVWQLKNSDQEPDTAIVCRSEGGLRVKETLDFALYVSRAPCGDASMDLLEDDDSAVWNDTDLSQYADPRVKTVLRGRSNYKKKGFVRTKPGRVDSNVTFSKSCTDKLCCRQSMSLLNALNWDLLEKPVFLKYIVVPQVSSTLRDGFERAFNTRLKHLDDYQPLELLSCSKLFPGDKKDENQEPALMGLIHLSVNSKLPPLQQCIVNGVKIGSFVRAPKPLRKKCETLISRAHQWSLFKIIRGLDDSTSYYDFKSRQAERNALKLKVRLALSKDGWVITGQDNC